jgi:hypothetical protein
VGLSSPLPRAQTARPSGCKGARNAREPATNPCSATGASGSHLPLLRFSREVGQSRREQKTRRRSKDDRWAINSDVERDFPSLRTAPVPPVIVGGTDPTGTYPWLWGSIGNRERCREGCQRTRLPSGGSPLAVLRVNLGHEYWPQRELSLPSLPRQFAQIAAC